MQDRICQPSKTFNQTLDSDDLVNFISSSAGNEEFLMLTQARKKKNSKQKSSKHLIYQSYPEILQEFHSFLNPFLSNDIFYGFEHRNGAEVAEKDVPPEVNITGKKK